MASSNKKYIIPILILIIVILFIFIIYNFTGSNKPKQRFIIVEKEIEVEVPVYKEQVISKQEQPHPLIYPVADPKYQMRHEYQQVGMLTSKDMDEGQPIILPLFGRKMTSRDRWEYYTASDKYNMWKLPVIYDNRDCQNEVGCNEIYNGVEVTVPDYANKVFSARIYKYNNEKQR